MLGSWATQVEVVAAALAYEIPVYFYSKKLVLHCQTSFLAQALSLAV